LGPWVARNHKSKLAKNHDRRQLVSAVEPERQRSIWTVQPEINVFFNARQHKRLQQQIIDASYIYKYRRFNSSYAATKERHTAGNTASVLFVFFWRETINGWRRRWWRWNSRQQRE